MLVALVSINLTPFLSLFAFILVRAILCLNLNVAAVSVRSSAR